MDATLLGWCAGIIDGEGSVTISRHGKKHSRYCLEITVYNTFRGALTRLKRAFGCGWLESRAQRTDGHHGNGKRIYMWRCRERSAHSVLVRVLPHLYIKKAQARVALAFFQERMKDSDVVEAHVATMRVLNRRGVTPARPHAF